MEPIKQNSKSPQKYIVLLVLFVLPIVAYLFFSSGVDNFLKLPKLTENIVSLDNFKDLNGEPVSFEDKITVAGFFGNQPVAMQGNAINLNEKIYERYHEFEDFQFLIFITEGAQEDAKILLEKLDDFVTVEKWNFAVGTKSAIREVFNSLGSNYNLDKAATSPYVFIIDKDAVLRGRTDDEDIQDGILYGYNSKDIAEVADKLNDDVKVLLAEYRLALKKNNADRKK